MKEILIVVLAVISIAAILDIIRKNRENERLTRSAEEVQKLKKDFISRVSHELKAPLASMLETTQLMIERIPGPLTEKQERLLHLNIQSGKRLARMIANILDLSSLEEHIVDYSMDLHDVGDIAQRVANDVMQQATDKSVRIMTDIAKDPLMVLCDPNRIAQVISNLLDNAVRFSPRETVIRLEAQLSDQSDVLIAIHDAAAGIADAHKKSIFEGFHPTRQEKKSSGESLGLGLAIARALVEAHNGTIWVENDPGGGNVFFVKLPKARSEAAALTKAG